MLRTLPSRKHLTVHFHSFHSLAEMTPRLESIHGARSIVLTRRHDVRVDEGIILAILPPSLRRLALALEDQFTRASNEFRTPGCARFDDRDGTAWSHSRPQCEHRLLCPTLPRRLLCTHIRFENLTPRRALLSLVSRPRRDLTKAVRRDDEVEGRLRVQRSKRRDSAHRPRLAPRVRVRSGTPRWF